MSEQQTLPTIADIFFTGFPKEFNLKRRLVHSLPEMLELINTSNMKNKGVYTSIFRYRMWHENKPVRDSAVVPAIYTDFDEGERSAKDVLKYHNWCHKHNYRHFVLFTGRGYHFYLFIQQNYADPRTMIRSFTNWLENEMGLMPDRSSINLAKMSRIPNTYNTKRGSYCIPLTHHQIHNFSYKEHFLLAQEQQFLETCIGLEMFDAQPYEVNVHYAQVKEITVVDLEDIPVMESIDDVLRQGLLIWDDLPNCVKYCLAQDSLNYDGRSVTARFLKEFGYSHGHVKEVLRQVLKPGKFQHAFDPFVKHIYWIFQYRYAPLSCKDIKETIGCPGGCGRAYPGDLLGEDEAVSVL